MPFVSEEEDRVGERCEELNEARGCGYSDVDKVRSAVRQSDDQSRVYRVELAGGGRYDGVKGLEKVSIQ